MTWYKEWFGTDYFDVYTHRNEKEAKEFIITLTNTLSIKTGQKVLDLCCGAGRYSIALAKIGLSVTALDLSGDLLDEARRSAEASGVNIDFIKRDMRDIPFVDYFDGVVNMFTSFGYFKSDEENERVIGKVAGSLKKGGWFVLDFMNRKFVLDNFRPTDESIKGEVIIKQNRRFNENENRIEKHIKLIKNGSVKEYFESVKLFSPDDLKRFFDNQGLKMKYLFGDYSGEKFNEDSPRVILIGFKS